MTRRPDNSSRPVLERAPVRVPARAQAFLSGDAAPEDDAVWLWAFPRGTVHKGGPWNLDADTLDTARRKWPWAVVLECLAGILAAGPRPLIWEHARDGLGAGLVEDWRCLTREEALAVGIPQTTDEAVYLRVRFTSARARAAYDDGSAIWTSPRFLPDYTDEAGVFWPWFLFEFSICSVPMQTRSAVPIPATRGVQLSADTTEGSPMNEETIAALEARIARIEAALEELRAAAAPAMAGDDDEDERSEPGAPPAPIGAAMSAPDTEAARLRARIERLERERALDDARARIARYDVAPEVALALESVALSAPVEFERVLGALPRANGATSASLEVPRGADAGASRGVALSASGLRPSSDSAFQNADRIAEALEADARALVASGQAPDIMAGLDMAEANWRASIA